MDLDAFRGAGHERTQSAVQGSAANGSKRLRQAGVFENAIGRVARDNLPIHRKRRVCNGTVPDFVIAFALSDEMATGLTENATHLAREIGHQLCDQNFRLVERA
jgi:hypothetical protein